MQHLYLNICIQLVNGSLARDYNFFYENPWLAFVSWMVSGSPRERDHYHKFPRQLHLSSHYPTHLPMSQEQLKQEKNRMKNKTQPIWEHVKCYLAEFFRQKYRDVFLSLVISVHMSSSLFNFICLSFSPLLIGTVLWSYMVSDGLKWS